MTLARYPLDEATRTREVASSRRLPVSLVAVRSPAVLARLAAGDIDDTGSLYRVPLSEKPIAIEASGEEWWRGVLAQTARDPWNRILICHGC